MGLPGLDYGEVSSLMARVTGGFHALLHSCSMMPGVARSEVLPTGIHDILGRDWIVFRLKALDEKIDPALDLILRIITEADFSDLKRLRDLSLEMKNDLDSSLAPSGHAYASGFSSRRFSRACAVNELWSGLDQILFAHKLIDLDVSGISAKLKNIQNMFAKAGVLINITGSADTEREIGKRFGAFGPPRPRNPASQDRENFFALSELKTGEVFASPSVQVGFASISLKASPYGSPLQAAELVLSHQVSTGALWEEIRMKGGAYGAFVTPDHLEGPFSFATYRDPNPLRSLDAFTSVIRDASQGKDNNLEKAVIGTYARETRPRTPMEKGLADFLRFLSGIEDAYRSRRLKDIVAVSEEQMDAARSRLANEIRATNGVVHANPVIIAGKIDAEKAAAHLGVKVQTLPV